MCTLTNITSSENTTGVSTISIIDKNLVNTDHASIKILWIVVDAILIIIILGGNALTIAAVYFNKRLSNVLSNQFVLSLAVSDFIVGLTIPYHLAFYVDTSLGANKTTCLMRFALITIALCMSVYNLTIIAVDRYVAIIYPLQYGAWMTRKIAAKLIMSGWVVSIVFGTLPLYWNKWTKCKPCDVTEVRPNVYIRFILTPIILVTWVTLVVIYLRIWNEVAKHMKRLKAHAWNGERYNNEGKSVKLVLLVLGSFSVTWIPYLCMMFAQTFNVTGVRFMYKVTFALAMANSGMNPIIYAWKNSQFRNAFNRLLKCMKPEKPQYDPNLSQISNKPSLHLKKSLSTSTLKLQLDTADLEDYNNRTNRTTVQTSDEDVILHL